MKKTVRMLLPAIAALTFSQTHAQSLVGITDANQLFVMSNVGSPAATSTPVPVSGLTAGQTIVGLDYRPATGELYAMGYNSTNNETQLYKVNPGTATLTAVNATPVTINLGAGPIGFDFNPTVDRIRVVSASRKNYRLNPVTGAIAAPDTDLGYALTDRNGLNTATITAVAYTNSYPGLTTTTLYDYDQNLNVLAIQNPPNNGTLNTVGSSGITVATGVANVDMDIYYNPSTRTNTAYFSARTTSAGTNNLYTINPTTGTVSQLGGIGLGVKNIAIQPYAIPTPGALTGQLIYALISGTKTMISFDSQNPRQLRSLTNISGVDSALNIVGMDFRPSNGMLYALGYQTGTNPLYKLYSINTTTGVASAINTSGTDTLGLGNTSGIGFDFNPTVDLIRVVSTMGANYRLNPTTGLVQAKDSNLSWTAGDQNASRTVRVSSVAYTNSFPGATATTLYGINDSGAVYVTVNPPNIGRLNTVSNGIFALNPADGTTDLDYFYDSSSRSNFGYLAANTGTSNIDLLYSLDAATGALTKVDTIAYGIAISDIAVMPMFRNMPSTGIAGGKYGTAPSVYPNPASQTISIVLPQAVSGSSFTISDLSGRSVKSGMLSNSGTTSKLSIGELAPGVYILQLQAAGEQYAPVRISKL